MNLESNKYCPLCKYLLLALILLAPLLLYSTPATAAEAAVAAKDSPVLMVNSTASVTVSPDQARISLAIVTSDKSLTNAQNSNTRTTKSVIDSLQKTGIDKNNLQTLSFNVYPQYDYSEKGLNSIISYQVRNEISVVVKDLDQLGAVLDIAIKAGANNVNSISFEKADPSEAENQALVKAIQRAREKALVMAQASGAQLGRMISISEGYSTPAVYRSNLYIEKAADSFSGAAIPITPADLTIESSVTLVYEIK